MRSLIPWGLSLFVLVLAGGAATAQDADRRSPAEPPDLVVLLSDDHTLSDSSLCGASDVETPNMERVAADGTPRLRPRSATPPNVITVFIDDMGWQDLSCFGGEDVETTHIDRLSEEGIRFTNFYVNSPICSPSRTALTTGQYPARHRITSFLARRKKNRQRGMAQWLDAGAVTLPRLMSEKGYRTGHFGKWHMGGQRDVGEAPLITEYGFDASLTNFEGLGPRVLPLCDAYDGSAVRRHDLGSADLGRGPIEWEDRSKITGRFARRAIAFIDASVALD